MKLDASRMYKIGMLVTVLPILYMIVTFFVGIKFNSSVCDMLFGAGGGLILYAYISAVASKIKELHTQYVKMKLFGKFYPKIIGKYTYGEEEQAFLERNPEILEELIRAYDIIVGICGVTKVELRYSNWDWEDLQLYVECPVPQEKTFEYLREYCGYEFTDTFRHATHMNFYPSLA